MTYRATRRRFLRDAVFLGAFVTSGFGLELARKTQDYFEQQATWEEASRSTPEFFARHGDALGRLRLAGSFAPEQWSASGPPSPEVMAAFDIAVRELGLREMRLGVRWGRVDDGRNLDLTPYTPLLDYCFENAVEVCLNVGPVRAFRWPEEHLPAWILADPTSLPADSTFIGTNEPLALRGADYIDRLLGVMRDDYGSILDKLASIQIENEPYYPLGAHHWQMSQPYMELIAEHVLAAMPETTLLVTSAGRLNLDSIRSLFEGLLRTHSDLQGRLISGFDFHYRTPMRQSYPLVRYLDQVGYATPFAPSLERSIWESRDLGYSIEVTEGQMEPYAQFQQPGNEARDLRYLLLRCLQHVLDPERPALIRLWGVEELTKHMLRGELTDEHRDIIQIIQRLNGTRPAQDQGIRDKKQDS
jgi:hypothetical protein